MKLDRRTLSTSLLIAGTFAVAIGCALDAPLDRPTGDSPRQAVGRLLSFCEQNSATPREADIVSRARAALASGDVLKAFEFANAAVALIGSHTDVPPAVLQLLHELERIAAAMRSS